MEALTVSKKENIKPGKQLYQSLRKLEEDLKNIEEDQEFMEKEFEAVRDYCVEKNFILSDEDLNILDSIGLGDWLDDWKENNRVVSCGKKEWLVTVWGGAWNADACPSIEHDYGINEGSYYFSTQDKKNQFINILNKPEYKCQGIVYTEKYGYMKHKKTVFIGNFEYKGQSFILESDFGYDFSPKLAINQYLTGNLSCDCNRSTAIRNKYGLDSMPDLGCGNEVKLVKYMIMYES